MEDPKTRTPRKGRIEISPKNSSKVIISFPPYLGTGYEDLLPTGSIELRFRYRPLYTYKKGLLGVTNKAPEYIALNIYQLRDLITQYGTPIIIIAPWIYPQPEQGPTVTWLKLEWPLNNLKKWTSRSAWNGTTKGKDANIISFWNTCAQLQPTRPLTESLRRNPQQRGQRMANQTEQRNPEQRNPKQRDPEQRDPE
jgi:hypothetical protein